MQLRPRHLRRYGQIAEVFTRHGFGAVVAQLGLGRYLTLPQRLLSREEPPTGATAAQHLRMALEELGSTFVKLGQILSTRPDVLPPAFIDELSKLQDEVPPGPWEPIQALIEEELGGPLGDFFLAFDPTPIAAASLAQVYAALLLDGKQVVVKVQRPGIERVVNTDLEIIQDLARLAQERTPLSDVYNLPELADEFSVALRGELDYRLEGRNADRFRQNFANESLLYVPEVYWDYGTRRVMVLERISGIKISDIAALDAAGYDRHRIATHAASFIIKMVIEDGFFHADPHPGNLVIMPGEVIGLMDFGTAGQLTAQDRTDLVRLYVPIIQLDAVSVTDQLERMGIADPSQDLIGLQRHLRRLLQKYSGVSLQEVVVSDLLGEIEPLIYDYRLRVPPDYWLLIKTLAIMEGVGKKLDPDFDVYEFSGPYVRRFLVRLALPSAWGPTLLRSATAWADLVSTFPRQSARIIDRVERGEMQFQVRAPMTRGTAQHWNQVANRLILGIVLAALIIALALLIPVLDLTWPWAIQTWAIVLGFTGMCVVGVWLFLSILRSSNRS
jgi:ubiquinone biosynthesis protein